MRVENWRKRLRGGVRFRGLQYELAGADDKAVGGCADVVERETGDEGESGKGRCAEDFDVGGGNDLSGVDKILKIASGGLQRDGVAELNVAKRAEKSVAVAGESDVAGCSGQGGFRDVADSTSQNGMGIALDNDGFEVKTGDLDFADHVAFDEWSRRQLRAASSLLQHSFEFRLFVGLIGARVHNDVGGIAEG